MPTASELSEVGLVQVEAAPLSSLQDTDVVSSADHANVAVVDVVDEDGVWVKEIVGTGVGGGGGGGGGGDDELVEACTVHATVALGCDLFESASVRVCAPTARFVKVIGLEQTAAPLWSSEHQAWPEGASVVQAIDAVVAVVVAGGADVTVITACVLALPGATARTSVSEKRSVRISKRSRGAPGR